MGELTREELAAMTDQELLAYEREHHGDPHMTLLERRDAAGSPTVLACWGGPEEADRGPRRMRGVVCFRSCFRPTPLVSLSPTAELEVVKVCAVSIVPASFPLGTWTASTRVMSREIVDT